MEHRKRFLLLEASLRQISSSRGVAQDGPFGRHEGFRERAQPEIFHQAGGKTAQICCGLTSAAGCWPLLHKRQVIVLSKEHEDIRHRTLYTQSTLDLESSILFEISTNL